jgi:Ni/Fe-hydrogenase 1 B-type cytochrome subunit
MAIMVITGFALYSNMSTAWFPQLFNWATALLGGDIMVRIVHHVAMWVFVIFIIIHVYLVFYHDYVEGRGEISSMGGGWKFVNEEVLEEHLRQENEEAERLASKRAARAKKKEKAHA